MALLSVTQLSAQICGCTDPFAINYDSTATINDGSCQYAALSINPTNSYQISNLLNGTSGMIFWEGKYWTFNDHNDSHLYALDSISGAIIDSLSIGETGNYDIEEISQDAEYLYFGNFGNNSGSRTDLCILRINKNDFLSHNFTIDTIFFNYADQVDFTPASMNTDYDCESFIVTEDSIYLFTKQWITKATARYSLPKSPGHHTACKRGTCNVTGLITGATYIPNEQMVVLCGYNETLEPFIYLLYDFPSDNFFDGNKRKIDINLMGHQVEAIATSNALEYYITNEYFQYSLMTVQPKLQMLNLTPYLSYYLTGDTTYLHPSFITPHSDFSPVIYPNPASDGLYIEPFESCKGMNYCIYSSTGQLTQSGVIVDNKISFQGYRMSKGNYILTIEGKLGKYSFRFYKQ
ncbi:MAG: T9SS type A sorting domain-containing protein [Bacteroidales bacterium]|nr:T9SS type A sorting domain-containing protein [Bacteroidales bacterium]